MSGSPAIEAAVAGGGKLEQLGVRRRSGRHADRPKVLYLRLLNRTVTRIYDAALRPHGLTAAQLNLLALLASLESARAGELADLLSMEISTLSRNAHLMEREGWITVQPAGRGNGRVLGLTKAGADKLEDTIPAWRQAQKQARSLPGEDGANLIRELVNRIWAKQANTR